MRAQRLTLIGFCASNVSRKVPSVNKKQTYRKMRESVDSQMRVIGGHTGGPLAQSGHFSRCQRVTVNVDL